MSEAKELSVLEIKPDQAPALYVPNGLDAYLKMIRDSVKEVPDLTTVKGRTRVASLAAQVSRSKTAIEKPGRDYLKRLKELPKEVEAELRRFVTECDAIRDETRRPLTEWEAEQDRIKAEEEARIAAEKLAAQIESDHEIALLMNDKFDRDAADAKAETERQRIAYEEELKRQAVEQARIEAEQKAQVEREAAAQREADLKAAAEKAERDRIDAQERAEREKQEAIAAERRKAEQAEAARLADQKRIADEQAKREANTEHKRTINRQVISALASLDIPEDIARKVLVAIVAGKVPNTFIRY